MNERLKTVLLCAAISAAVSAGMWLILDAAASPGEAAISSLGPAFTRETVRTQNIEIVDDKGRVCGSWNQHIFSMHSPEQWDTRGAFEVFIGKDSARVQIEGTRKEGATDMECSVITLQAIADWPRLAMTKGYKEVIILEALGRIPEVILNRDDGKKLLAIQGASLESPFWRQHLPPNQYWKSAAELGLE